MKILLKSNLIFMAFAFVSGFLLSMDAQACVASRDPRYDYFISYERPFAGLFKDGTNRNEVRPTIIDQCQESSGQYLMVALAVRSPRINGNTADISLVKKLNDDSCHIIHNPFPLSQTYFDRYRNFENQFQVLRTCAYYDISEINGNEIEFPDLQPAARIERIDSKHIRAYGDFVFVKVSRNSRFAIGVGLKKECTDKSFLIHMGLQPGDVQGLLNTYLTHDFSGNSTDVTPIGSSRIRVALTPASDLMPVGSMSSQLDSPAWPVTYKTDVEFGSLTIRSQNDSRFKLDFSPLVDNFAPTRCLNGICSVENSFQSPVAGLVELTDLGLTRNKVIDSWYFGSSAPSQYQGFVESVSRYIEANQMTVGKSYSIEMSMVDPYEDYFLFQSNIPQLLININSQMGTPGADEIQSLGQLSALSGLAPISGIGKISGGDSNRQIDAIISALNSTRIVRNWPAYFEKICIEKGVFCFKRGQVKLIKKIGARFILGKAGEDRINRLENLVIYHSDPVHGYHEISNAVQPSIECEGSFSK